MIDEVYKVVNVLLNKNGYGVITPDEFNSVCGLAQSKIYSEIPNRLRMKYNRDKQGYSAIPKDILESTLYKLAVVEDLEKGEDDPFFPFPPTEKLNAVYREGKEATLIDVARLRMIGNSRYNRPSVTYPNYSVSEDGIQVLPDSTSIEVHYYKIPPVPRWTYVAVEGKPVFNPSDKRYQDFTLTRHFFNVLVVEIALCFGVHLREAEVIQVMAQDQANEFQKDNAL